MDARVLPPVLRFSASCETLFAEEITAVAVAGRESVGRRQTWALGFE